jgi:hypothetical protein
MTNHYPFERGSDSFLRATSNLKKPPMKSCFKKTTSLAVAVAALDIKPGGAAAGATNSK